mmetsp:Transcript_7150/g.14957  ORF Transcript_7150/g.14957 Transcript_7150/m.14957 type:complete len:217 (-) Transcript_7150:186-836(-)
MRSIALRYCKFLLRMGRMSTATTANGRQQGVNQSPSRSPRSNAKLWLLVPQIPTPTSTGRRRSRLMRRRLPGISTQILNATLLPILVLISPKRRLRIIPRRRKRMQAVRRRRARRTQLPHRAMQRNPKEPMQNQQRTKRMKWRRRRGSRTRRRMPPWLSSYSSRRRAWPQERKAKRSMGCGRKFQRERTGRKRQQLPLLLQVLQLPPRRICIAANI